ncbi:hypothetical protein [Nocardioides terrigena]|uniref:hypothetical protein n=1 Tax=Nocardioides terrigena TaxID=424797 RepID=UPI000D30268A|nr:hypothetical protein [Nocardioides terrigena]
MTQPAENDACPTCGPTTVERHPRRPCITRCANCKEWLHRTENDAAAEGRALRMGIEFILHRWGQTENLYPETHVLMDDLRSLIDEIVPLRDTPTPPARSDR